MPKWYTLIGTQLYTTIEENIGKLSRPQLYRKTAFT